MSHRRATLDGLRDGSRPCGDRRRRRSHGAAAAIRTPQAAQGSAVSSPD